MRSSLLFSSHNFEKLILDILSCEKNASLDRIISSIDDRFEIKWWQRRSKTRKMDYLKSRIKRLKKKNLIKDLEGEIYQITDKGREYLSKKEERDTKISNITKMLINPSIAYSISLVSIFLLFTIKFLGFLHTQNLLFAIDGISFVIISINWYNILISEKLSKRALLLKTIQIIDIFAGIVTLIIGLMLLNGDFVTINQADSNIIILITIIIALISYLAIHISGYLNDNLNLQVLGMNHRTAIFSPLFVLIAYISLDFNLNFTPGLIIIIFGIDLLAEVRRSNPKNFTHHILILLNNEPHSYEEMFNLDNRIAMFFGAPMFFRDNPEPKHQWMNETGIRFLLLDNLIEKREDDLYYLTDKAIPEADHQANGMIQFFSYIKTLMQPKVSPILSLIVHLLLGTLKLVGYVLTGSVGLLGDGLDSALDGVSSILVTIAMKIKRETEATYLLIVLMIISGLGIIGSSIFRIVDPQPLTESDYGIFVAILSIIICLLLYLYQRYSGFINRSLTIITQSEDSKNHVYNASLVLLAIFANFFKIYIIDGVVGAFIGILILRGAYDIFTDIRSYNQGEAINFEKYRLGLWKTYNRFQYQMLEKWVLYQIFKGVNTFEDLIEKFNWEFRPLVIKESNGRSFTLSYGHKEEDLSNALQSLNHKAYVIVTQETIEITEKGKELSRKQKHRHRHT